MLNNSKEECFNTPFFVSNYEMNNKENLFESKKDITPLKDCCTITHNINIKENCQHTFPVKINLQSKENLESVNEKTDLKINYRTLSFLKKERIDQVKAYSCSTNIFDISQSNNKNDKRINNENKIVNNYLLSLSNKNYNPFEKFNYKNINPINISIDNKLNCEFIGNNLNLNMSAMQSLNKKPHHTQSDRKSLMLSLSKMNNNSCANKSIQNNCSNAINTFSEYTNDKISTLSSFTSFSSICSNSNITLFTNISAFLSVNSNPKVTQKIKLNQSNSGNTISMEPSNFNFIPEDQSETDENLNRKSKYNSENILKENEKNLLIPEEKKNDEAYKLLKINKHIKKVEVSKFSSTRRINDFKKIDTGECDDLHNYNILRKKKKIHSVKRLFVSETKMIDTFKNKVKTFKIFRDSEIGINEYWQSHIISAENDEDLETEDEQINIAGDYLKGVLKMTMNLLAQPNSGLEIFNTYILKE